MAHASPEALQAVLPLLRQLRDIKTLKEKQPGIFYCRSAAFLHFHDEAGALVADLKKTSGSGFDRYPLTSPLAHRKLLDDAKLRALRADRSDD
jgi:hypothetical protein